MANYIISPSCLECGKQMLRSIPVNNISDLLFGIKSTDGSFVLPSGKDVVRAEIYVCDSHADKCSIKITTKYQRHWFML